ncbi:hypothetical protein ACF0H5_012224 [Mactra antiquata]
MAQEVSNENASDDCTDTMNITKKRKIDHREKAWKRKGKQMREKQIQQRRIIFDNINANRKQHPSGPWKIREQTRNNVLDKPK